MATSVRVEMNTAGAIAILKSDGVVADLERRAAATQSAAQSANPDGEYSVESWTGKTRARVTILTANYSARKSESIDRTLTRALDAARG